MRNRYGQWGKQIPLFEVWQDWAEKGEERVNDLREAADAGNAEAALMLEEVDTRFDFPNFLFGPVSTSIWGAYSQVAPQYRRYSRIENMPDLRERRLRGLNAVRGMAYVGENGEYVEGRRTERPSAGLTVDKYGFVYKITMEAIINDETGDLLNRIPGEMGRDASTFVATTLIALIESNPVAPDGSTMFNATRGNVTTSALSEDSIVDGISYFDSQVDDSGYPITVRAASLIVRNARTQLVAARILNSTFAGTTINWTGAPGVGTNVFDKGTINPVAGLLPNDSVVKEVFFTDTNDWYLFADPNDVPGFALGFLNGNEQPFVGLKEPAVRNAMGPGVDPYTFEFDSLDFKVRHFFGVAPVDPRGVFRATVP
jgi:hypothetical protein